MTNPDVRKTDDIADVSVSAVYRDGTHPTVPHNLEKAILQQAAGEVGEKSWLEVVNLWLRPVTYAATLGLCAVLLVNTNNIPDIRESDEIVPATNPFSTPESAENQSTAFRNAAEQAARQLQNAEANNRVNLDEMPADGYSEPSVNRNDRATSGACSTIQRSHVEHWASCIAELQAIGAHEDAALESGMLREAFPEYRLDAIQ